MKSHSSPSPYLPTVIYQDGLSSGAMNQPFDLILNLFAVLSLLAVPFLTGCQSSIATRQVNQSVNSNATNSSVAVSDTPDVQIFVDEAMLRKPYAILGGTLKNSGSEKLENLSLDFELVRRADGTKEKREVSVEPREIAPGGTGKYSLKVLSDEWSGSRIVRLRSSSRTDEISFKTLQGARRPPEKTTSETRVVKDARPRSNPKGEEFLNTPDDPVAVP